MVSASEISIDIGVSKMLDWLVDRRHCTARWQKIASQAKSAASSALKETDSDEIVKKICQKFDTQVCRKKNHKSMSKNCLKLGRQKFRRKFRSKNFAKKDRIYQTILSKNMLLQWGTYKSARS